MWLAGILVGAVVAAIGVFKLTRGGHRDQPIEGGSVSESWLAEQRAQKDLGSDR
jgi:hypothetical protein